MSKTILAQVDGFTPIIDSVLADVGLVTAAVFGKIWRYCQREDGVCYASQERIAKELGLSRKTVNYHIERLVAHGYLEDKTPGLVGKPHIYADSGKAGMSISVTATAVQDQIKKQPVTESYRGCNGKLQLPVTESYSSCNEELQLPVTKSYLKKQLRNKKDNDNDNDDKGEIFRLYEQTIGVITPYIADCLVEAEETYPLEWIKQAFKVAAEANVHNWRYVSACLRNWKANGIAWKPGQPTPGPDDSEPAHSSKSKDYVPDYVPCPPGMELQHD